MKTITGLFALAMAKECESVIRLLRDLADVQREPTTTDWKALRKVKATSALNTLSKSLPCELSDAYRLLRNTTRSDTSAALSPIPNRLS
jgi:hypothetical protein